LQRVFAAEYNVSPVQYLQTCRLLLAKSLLTDTELTMLEVAIAVGFGSVRRFNDLFKKQYHLSPTALRKSVPGNEKQSGGSMGLLGYRPPYRWEEMLDFLGARAIGGVDMVKDSMYWRTAHFVNVEEKRCIRLGEGGTQAPKECFKCRGG
jgi:AraC family transcriptional regulator of adaptative response / DNA-3-methyladenine glycosylase II